jgi:hypothetical protein
MTQWVEARAMTNTGRLPEVYTRRRPSGRTVRRLLLLRQRNLTEDEQE